MQYIISDAQIRYLFVGEQEQYDKAHRIFALCPSLERIIIYTPGVRVSNHDPNAMTFEDFMQMGQIDTHDADLERLYGDANFDDTANILYTSGTTGDSKGVILSYGQYYAAMDANGRSVNIDENDIILNFLPLTHIFERGWAILSLSQGAQLAINQYPKDVQMAMREVHPTSMSSVPRF